MENKIKITKNGPSIVSGEIPFEKETIIVDADDCPVKWKKGKKFQGKEAPHLCRCGKSRNTPFCDGSHADAGFDDGMIR